MSARSRRSQPRSEHLRQKKLLDEKRRVEQITKHTHHMQNQSTLHHSRRPSLFKHDTKTPRNKQYPQTPRYANPIEPAKENKSTAPKLRLSWRILSGVLTIVFISVIMIAWRSPDTHIMEVRVDGLNRIKLEEVQEILNLQGQSIFTLQPTFIQRNLSLAFPEFKIIDTIVNLNNQVLLSVTERQPLITWKTDNNILWIDEEGYMIPLRGEAGEMLMIESHHYPDFYYPSLNEEGVIEISKYHQKRNNWKSPLHSMEWFKYHQQITPALLNSILTLSALVPENKTLLYDPHRGLGWHDPHGWMIFIGFNLENIIEKWMMYEKIVSELNQHGIQPTLVSIEYLHAPYYRLD